jgi:hypothetical protein
MTMEDSPWGVTWRVTPWVNRNIPQQGRCPSFGIATLISGVNGDDKVNDPFAQEQSPEHTFGGRHKSLVEGMQGIIEEFLEAISKHRRSNG